MNRIWVVFDRTKDLEEKIYNSKGDVLYICETENLALAYKKRDYERLGYRLIPTAIT